VKTRILPFTIHDLRYFAAADRRQDRNLAVVWEGRIEELFAPNVIVVEKNVYMRSQVSLFIQHPIAQAEMLLPQTIQGVTNGRGRNVDDNLALPIRKVS